MTRPTWQSLTQSGALCAAAILTVIAPVASAQQQPSGASRGDADAAQRARLDNGLTVLAQRATASGVAAICISYRAGSRDEPAGQQGLARLVESLMTQGSRNLGSGDALRLLSERGGTNESSTEADLTQFCSQLPAHELSVALWVEADRLKNLSATNESFAAQRDLLLMQQHARTSSELHSRGLQRLSQLAYQDYRPYQNGVLGSSNDLASLSLANAQDFHWRYYAPRNAVLTIVADESPARAVQLAARYFGNAADRATAPATASPAPESPQSSERLSVLSDENCASPGVYYGFRVAKAGSDDHLVARLIAHILAGSDAARLPQSLLVERGSALHVNAWLVGNHALDLLAIYAHVAPLSSVDKVQEVVDAELKRLRFFGPTAPELDRAKASLQSEWEQTAASSIELAKALGRREALGQPFDVQRDLATLRAITPDQIRRVAQLYLPDHKRSIVEIYPPRWPQDDAPLVVVLKHTVKRGENLEGIARRYGSSVAEIARLSRLDTKRPIQPGQLLKVPVVGGKVPPKPAAMRSHKVRAGDSLSVIAKTYGTAVSEIVRLNGLDRNKPIMVGQKLIIPPKQPSSPPAQQPRGERSRTPKAQQPKAQQPKAQKPRTTGSD